VRAGKVNVIVVYKVDRLTRSLADFAKLAGSNRPSPDWNRRSRRAPGATSVAARLPPEPPPSLPAGTHANGRTRLKTIKIRGRDRMV